MARYGRALWRPLPESEQQGQITPTQLILHTAVDAPGPTDLYRYFERRDVTLESHFWLPLAKVMEQFIDTERSADANRLANRRLEGGRWVGAISVETEDEGRPSELPWNDYQQEQLVELMIWAHRVHGIPLKQCESWTGAGIGWHSMWGAPSPWTPAAGKTCPGPKRIAQIPGLIARARLQLGGHLPDNPPPPTPLPQSQEDDMFWFRLSDGPFAQTIIFVSGKEFWPLSPDEWKADQSFHAAGPKLRHVTQQQWSDYSAARRLKEGPR